MDIRTQAELDLVARHAELTQEDLINLGKFAITEAWRTLAPKLTNYLGALALAELKHAEKTPRVGLEDWTHRDVADGIVGCCGMLEVSLSPTYEFFAQRLLRLLAAENVARLTAAPVIAAMN